MRFAARLFLPAAAILTLAAPAAGQKNGARPSAFNLHSNPVQVLDANELECIITSSPGHCVMAFTSPLSHGLFWPRGTTNGYVFNAGIQVAGMMPMAAGCTAATRQVSREPGCFPWSGDTAGAFFYDVSGVRNAGTALTPIYDSLDRDDLSIWPGARTLQAFPSATGVIDDSAIFHESLIGTPAASTQDTWSAYWEGEPARGAGSRPHPLGLLVEQRTMAWPYPAGNEATIYFVFRLTNVTNNSGFQRLNEARYFDGADALPDAGWRLDSLLFSYAWDPDVTNDYANNHLTTIPALDMMFAYQSRFSAPDFTYPPAQFHPPFYTDAPGLVGIRFLRTPGERGMLSANAYTGGGAFPVPATVQRYWRLNSMRPSPASGDPFCILPPAELQRRRACWLSPAVAADWRGVMSTGHFSLAPGESETIIVAVFAAAAVATPLIERTPFINVQPGLPTPAPGCNGEPVRVIEVAAGWLSGACPDHRDELTPEASIHAVPGSLVHKALAAQRIADAGFLLPSAPAAPPFYLVPGDGRVTVVWEPSPTETTGDPYADLAGGALHDPNFRRHDVEGYRVYRGLSPTAMELVAQFDRRDTHFTDALCLTDPAHLTGTPCTATVEAPVSGQMLQYRTVAALANGSRRVLDTDTAFAARPLTDSGIPFAFVDTNVRNGITYFYRVAAFDFNSIASGPSSLESPGPVKTAQPRADATSLTGARVAVGLFGRERQLSPAPPVPPDPLTGMFAGPQPPTPGLDGIFTELAGQVLARGAAELRIDSVLPGYYPNGVIATYHLTIDGVPATATFTNRTSQANPGTVETVDLPVVSLDADPAARAALQARGVDVPHLAGQLRAALSVERPHWNSLHANWAYKNPGFWVSDPPDSWAGGSRWFSGATETLPDPAAGVAVHGRLDGVARIFQPTPYRSVAAPSGEAGSTAVAMASYRGLSEQIFRRFYGTVLGVTRGADVRLFWGAAGLDSVIDVTHNVPVPFSTAVRASYGFLTDADEDGVLTYGDFYYLRGLETSPANEITPFALAARPLTPQPAPGAVDVTGDLAGDGTGFGLYINGEPWLFESAVPTNTVWTLRTYNGAVTRTQGRYSMVGVGGNAAVPGLRFAAVVDEPARVVAAAADLSRVHTVPDPYYAVSGFDTRDQFKELHFVNLPARATIRIYTLSGVLVDVISHDDAGAGGRLAWDLRGRGNHYVRSGVYLFHLSTPEGRSHVGRFTVISNSR